MHRQQSIRASQEVGSAVAPADHDGADLRTSGLSFRVQGRGFVEGLCMWIEAEEVSTNQLMFFGLGSFGCLGVSACDSVGPGCKCQVA